MTILRVIEPNESCDRCGHQSRRHAPAEDWSACRVKGCPCDGFFPVPRKAAKRA